MTCRARQPSASIIDSRFSRSLYVGRQRTARGIAISSRGAQDVAPERRARGSARPPRGPLGDPRRGVVQGDRVPACGGADPGVAAADRRARARGQGEGAARDRQDDRDQGRRGRRGRRDARAHEAPRSRSGGCRRLPPASRSRPEDGSAHLDAARHHLARRAEVRGRGRAAARPLRNGRAERGEDPEGARGGRR